jgi:hypothetical protein
MSDVKTATAQPEQPRSMQLCHVILETVNAQEIPISQRSDLLDGMLMAYLTVANLVGLTENAALVMTDEGTRILRHFHHQRHQAGQAAQQGASAPAVAGGDSTALKAAADAGEIQASTVDPDAVMDSIRQAARSKLH